MTLLELYKLQSHKQLVEWIVVEFGIAHTESMGASTTSDHRPPASANKHKLRRMEMGERVRLYRDDAAKDLAVLIGRIWTRADYQENLKRYIGIIGGECTHQGVATSQNTSVRIVHEVASIYDQPAMRTLGHAGQQVAFKADEVRLRLHEITQDYQRLLWLCNDVLIWQFTGVDGKTKLRVVTPDIFDAVPDPRDVTAMAGVLMEVPRITASSAQVAAKLPRWELWDDTYRYLISAGGQLVDENGEPTDTPIAHGQDRIPGVLLHRREPSERCLDPRAGRDIAAAHRAVSLLNILLLRLSKGQGEKQPVLQGNLANVSKGQTADGENPIVLPPEVTLEMLDSVTDPGHLLKTKREVLVGVGLTYGVSYEQLTYEDDASNAGSAALYLARREKLLELRSEQIRRANVNEGLVIELIGYPSDGLKVDHAEPALPQDPTDEMALLDLRMRVGVDSPVKFLQRKDPDLTREQAIALMKSNIGDWAQMIQMVRALNIPLGATSANPGNDPQINGSGKIVEKLSFGDLDGTTPQPVQQAGNAPRPPGS